MPFSLLVYLCCKISSGDPESDAGRDSIKARSFQLRTRTFAQAIAAIFVCKSLRNSLAVKKVECSCRLEAPNVSRLISHLNRWWVSGVYCIVHMRKLAGRIET